MESQPESQEAQPIVVMWLSNVLTRAKKIIFFLVASQGPSFLFTRFLLLSQYTIPLCSFTFLSLFLSPSSLPFFPLFSPSIRFFFLFPFFLDGVVAQWCTPLALKPEKSGGVGSSPGKAPPLERHEKGSRTRLGLLYFCDPSAWR